MNKISRFLRKMIFEPAYTKAAKVVTKLVVGNSQFASYEMRLANLENRLLDYYRNRWDAIDNLLDYLVGAEIPGDYLEFGVYKGATFTYAYQKMHPVFPQMKFIAFDSFEGLPEPKGLDNMGGYSSSFFQGQYAFSDTMFTENLERLGVDMKRVRVVKGWFDKILNPEVAKSNEVDKIAAAWIDCDLYESTVPVLEFITGRLSVGSVLLFDDWHCFRNLPDFGEQRACREWLAANPTITLRELFSFGFHGEAFTVSSC